MNSTRFRTTKQLISMSLWQYLWAMTIPKSILIDTAIYLGARLRRFSMNHYTIKFELRITCSRSQHFEKLRNIPKTFGTKIYLELRRLIFWHQLKTSEKKTDQTSRRWRVYLVCHSPNFFFSKYTALPIHASVCRVVLLEWGWVRFLNYLIVMY